MLNPSQNAYLASRAGVMAMFWGLFGFNGWSSVLEISSLALF
jgi:hypothetical protein